MAVQNWYLKEPQKSFGATIATSHQSTASTAKKQLEEKIFLALKSIDSRPIRGEYKVWIFRNYVVPSSRFLLTVDPISDNGIRSIQSTATKFKKWLRLPRNAIYTSDPFPPWGPQLSTSSNWEAEGESLPASHHLHLMWYKEIIFPHRPLWRHFTSQMRLSKFSTLLNPLLLAFPMQNSWPNWHLLALKSTWPTKAGQSNMKL